MYLALNDQQWLICHKTKQNKTKQNLFESPMTIIPKKDISYWGESVIQFLRCFPLFVPTIQTELMCESSLYFAFAL